MNISVIIPVYNEEKTIQKVVRKIIKQEILIHEIIIVDDNYPMTQRIKLTKFL